MRLVAITEDQTLEKSLNIIKQELPCELNFYNDLLDPLDIMSYVCKASPNLLLIDDDCLKPNTAHIMESIKKVNKNIKIVFFTSNSSKELGREILSIGIHYYGIKPISDNEVKELFESFNKLENKTHN